MNKFKKAFTLVEISIVLLVLAFLIVGILISKKIVTRTQVQSIITDFQDLKKNVLMFQDNYKYLPGNIPETECMKYKELNKFTETSGYYKETGTGFISIRYGSCFATRQMQESGFIQGVQNGEKDTTEECDFSLHKNYIANNTKKSSFNKEVAIILFGIIPPDQVSNTEYNNYTNFASPAQFIWDIQKVPSLGEPLSEAGYYPYIGNYVGIISSTAVNVAAVTASMALDIDSKMDDGKPYTGKVISSRVLNYNDMTISTIGVPISNRLPHQKGIQYCSVAQKSAALEPYKASEMTAQILRENNNYQTQSPDSFTQGCNMFYKID